MFPQGLIVYNSYTYVLGKENEKVFFSEASCCSNNWSMKNRGSIEDQNREDQQSFSGWGSEMSLLQYCLSFHASIWNARSGKAVRRCLSLLCLSKLLPLQRRPNLSYIGSVGSYVIVRPCCQLGTLCILYIFLTIITNLNVSILFRDPSTVLLHAERSVYIRSRWR